MSNIICERLMPFKTKLQAEVSSSQIGITRIMNTIMNAYAEVIDTATAEEIQTLATIKNDVELIMHNTIHLKDVLQTIGQPAIVERFFNIENGEVIEVDKEHFVGLPDDDEAKRD